VTTDGFLLQEAALWPSEGTVAAADDARHQLAFGVRVADTLFVDDYLSTCRELRPKVVELFLDVDYLVQCNRCTCISFLTATPMTAIYVATKVFRQDVGMQDDIAYLDEITKQLVAGHAG